jgi:uncharacterized membrane protein YidH (DUF202 family)
MREIHMTDAATPTNLSSNQLALERTRMAGVRTEFALMRTGFAVSSFGAGIAEYLGRDNWPDLATDFLTVTFVVVGMVFVQVGVIRIRTNAKALGTDPNAGPFAQRVLKLVPWLLQLSLLSLLVLILIH